MGWIKFFRAGVLCQLVELAACATPAQREYSATVAAVKDAVAQGKQCYAQLANDPAYATLGQHIPLAPVQPSLAQQADTAWTSASEIALMVDWYRGVQLCRQQLIASSQQSFSFLTAVFEQNFAVSDAIYVRLVQHQVTYGEANRELVQALREGAARIIVAGKEWETDLRQRSELEAIAGPLPDIAPVCSETGSCYGDISEITGLPKTNYVNGYYRADGTHVGSYYRSP